jgi:hypothetical protein
MKPKLFKQSKDHSLADDSLNYVGTKPKFSITINKGKIAKKTAVIGITTVAVAGLSIGVLMGVNSFFNTHYFEFRTPVIFQQPILLHQREIKLLSPLPEEISMNVQAAEPTPTPKPQIVLSARAQGCADAQPIVAMKLEEAFGGEASTAIELICRESSLNPMAVNKSSGACGLFQAYPCAKMKCELTDVDCQITWGKDYIKNRYKTVEAALLFHDKKGWY